MVTLDKIALSVPRDLISDWRHNPRVYNSKYTDLPYHLGCTGALPPNLREKKAPIRSGA